MRALLVLLPVGGRVTAWFIDNDGARRLSLTELAAQQRRELGVRERLDARALSFAEIDARVDDDTPMPVVVAMNTLLAICVPVVGRHNLRVTQRGRSAPSVEERESE